MNERQRYTIERARSLCMRAVQDVEVESAFEAAVLLEWIVHDEWLASSRRAERWDDHQYALQGARRSERAAIADARIVIRDERASGALVSALLGRCMEGVRR